MTSGKQIVLDWNLRMELLKAGVGDGLQSNGKLPENKGGPKSLLKVKRSSFITSALIDREVQVHNGKSYMGVKVNKGMVGYRFGEFVNTSVWGGGAVLGKGAKSTKQQPTKAKKPAANKSK